MCSPPWLFCRQVPCKGSALTAMQVWKEMSQAAGIEKQGCKTDHRGSARTPCCRLQGFGRAACNGTLVIWEGNEEGQKDIKWQQLNIFFN